METLTTEVAGAILSPVVEMLQADGYDLDVSVSGADVRLVVSAGPEACAECLVPPPVFTGIVRTTLQRAGYSVGPERISLTYPEARG